MPTSRPQRPFNLGRPAVPQPWRTESTTPSKDLPEAASTTTFPITASDWRTISEVLSLSVREAQIARLFLDDLQESAIALRLQISPRTVHALVERLYRKLRVHSRHQMVTRLFDTYIRTCRTESQT